jgi:S-adenosylmethionine-diacylgycerolhomoserine-N-methlytransferase
MLDTAATNIITAGLSDRISLLQGDAANVSATGAFDVSAFDRVFYAYTLSMIPIWREALGAGVAKLAEGGRIHVVDFGQQGQLPGWFRKVLFKWLQSFYLTPRAHLKRELEKIAERTGSDLMFQPLYRGYTDYAELMKRRKQGNAQLV